MKIKMLFVLLAFASLFSSAVFAEAATGLCKDGTEYTGKSKRGACRGHDGLKEWYAEKDDKDKDDSDSKKTKSKKASKGTDKESAKAEEAATGPATGLCKDGYETSGTNKRSACRGHDGIKEWYADKNKDDAKADKEDKKAKKAGKEKAADKDTATKDEPKAAATGLCKDGTEYTGESKRGACRGHKGLKEWYADSEENESELIEEEPERKDSSAKKADDKPVKTKRPPKPAAGSGKVWANPKSKIYHCEDSRFYGTTKEGEYMSESEANDKGYRANRHQECK